MSNPPPPNLGDIRGCWSEKCGGGWNPHSLSVVSPIQQEHCGNHMDFCFTRNAKARSLQPFSSAALTVCFWIMAQSQVDSIVFQRPAVFIKNLLSRYLVNHVL